MYNQVSGKSEIPEHPECLGQVEITSICDVVHGCGHSKMLNGLAEQTGNTQ